MTAYEASQGSYSNRGGIITPEDLLSTEWLKEAESAQAHRSYFAFEAEKLNSYLSEHGAMKKNYGGSAYLHELVFDFDGAVVDLSHTLVEVRNFVRHLIKGMDVPEEYIQVWFSGYKGFHVHLDGRLFNAPPSPDLPYVIKKTVQDHFAHPLIDTAPINTAGLIRAPWTKHHRGTYKTLIPLRDLFSKQTPEMGVLPSMQERQKLPLWPKEAPDAVLQRYLSFAKRHSTFASDAKSIAKHDPTAMVTCMQKVFLRGPVKGRRHKDMLRVASWLWRSGIPKEGAIAAMAGWQDTDEEVARVIHQVYDRGYAYGCHDEVMSEYCDERCVFNRKKNFAMDVQGHEELAANLEQYTELLDSGKGFNLFHLYDKSDLREYRVLPYHLVLLLADTGIGKTLFMQDLLVKLRKRTLYLNLEMPEALMTRRFLQSEFGLTEKEVLQQIRTGRAQEMIERIDWLKMISEAPTLDVVERAVQQYKPEILVVDTTDGISVPEAGNSEMWHLRVIIEGLRKIARRYHTIVFAVHHINKSGARAISGEEDKPRRLSLNDATGNRSNVTKMDHVIGIEGKRDDTRRKLTSLKVRDGKPLNLPVEFDYERMAVTIEEKPF